MIARIFSVLLVSLIVAGPLSAEGIRLEGFEYPFPVKTFELATQRQQMEMAWMEVIPEGEPKGTVVLLHGKNFSGAYWGETAKALQESGYRVIMPDQIGFGKSSKPEHYYFTFHQLARNTHELLKSIGVEKVHVVGHSMGGMLATRFALMFPENTQTLTLLNPIGLEDWKAKGVPYTPLEKGYEAELAKTPEKIRDYQKESYYDGQWKPEYDRWVEMLVRFTKSEDYPRMAWDQALTSEMVYTQPVLYEFPELTMPVLLIIGQRDRTAIGKNQVSEKVRATLGNYPELGRAAAKSIPDAKLVEIEAIGHLPHIEAFGKFIDPLSDFLNRHSAGDGD